MVVSPTRATTNAPTHFTLDNNNNNNSNNNNKLIMLATTEEIRKWI